MLYRQNGAELTSSPDIKEKTDIRHGLIYGFNAISHGKLVDDLLTRFFKVNLPAIITFGTW